MDNVTSYSEFLLKASGAEKFYLLLYKPGSGQSDCALSSLEDAIPENSAGQVYIADVNLVRDIHIVFGITTVPSLLVFSKGQLTNVIKGCQESGYYRALFSSSLYRTGTGTGGKGSRRVTVYSTPTCSWCNTLKAWLKKNNISYTDVDVSKDPSAAEALVRRSGQQGVPQTDINGEIVVGFNQQKLKELLEIQ